jgi:hypothetical protein
LDAGAIILPKVVKLHLERVQSKIEKMVASVLILLLLRNYLTLEDSRFVDFLAANLSYKCKDLSICKATVQVDTQLATLTLTLIKKYAPKI